MNALRSFPLLVIPIVLYNLLVLVNPWSADAALACTEELGLASHPLTCDLYESWFEFRMSSTLVVDPGADPQQVYWSVTLSDVMLAVGLTLLFFELLKSTTIASSSIVNHALSLIVFVIGLVEFLMWPAFATSTFFLLITMALLDVLAGFIVTIAAARRDVSLVG